MTDQISFPPLFDLSPGEVAAHKQHLLSEIAGDCEKTWLPMSGTSRLRLRFAVPAVTVIGAAAIAVALVSTTGNSPHGTVATPIAPVYAFHVSLKAKPGVEFDGFGYRASEFASNSESKSESRAQHVPLRVFVLAEREAVLNGDRHPIQAQWVKTTRQLAVSSQSGGRVDGAHRSVYFVVLQGRFIDKDAYYLARGKKSSNAAAPHGTVLTFTADAKSGNILDFTLGSTVPNLSNLGTPHHFAFGDRRSP